MASASFSATEGTDSSVFRLAIGNVTVTAVSPAVWKSHKRGRAHHTGTICMDGKRLPERRLLSQLIRMRDRCCRVYDVPVCWFRLVDSSQFELVAPFFFFQEFRFLKLTTRFAHDWTGHDSETTLTHSHCESAFSRPGGHVPPADQSPVRAGASILCQ